MKKKDLSDLEERERIKSLITEEKREVFDFYVKKYVSNGVRDKDLEIILNLCMQKEKKIELTVRKRFYEKYIEVKMFGIIDKNKKILETVEEIMDYFDGEEIAIADRTAIYFSGLAEKYERTEEKKIVKENLLKKYLKNEEENKEKIEFLFEQIERSIALENKKRNEKREQEIKKGQEAKIDDLLNGYSSLLMLEKIMGENDEIKAEKRELEEMMKKAIN